MPLVGKSSLLDEALAAVPVSTNCLRVRLVPRPASGKSRLLASLVTAVWKELNAHRMVPASARRYRVKAADDGLSWATQLFAAKRFLSDLREAGIELTIVIDSLDALRGALGESLTGYCALRDLASYPEYRFQLLTTAQTLLLLPSSPEHSSLVNVLSTHRLLPLRDENQALFCSQLSDCGVDLTPDSLEELDALCGGHPYLLSAIGSKLAQMAALGQKPDSGLASLSCSAAFDRLYSRLLALASSLGVNTELQHVITGETTRLESPGMRALEEMGFIQRSTSSEGYAAFSHHFQAWLLGRW
jgi:hypothetical protein